jgi:hypothetical protein
MSGISNFPWISEMTPLRTDCFWYVTDANAIGSLEFFSTIIPLICGWEKVDKLENKIRKREAMCKANFFRIVLIFFPQDK